MAEGGRTPLMEACRRGDLEAVRALIAEGADVNSANQNGTTPLMYAKTAAFGSGDLRIMEALIAAGADVAARDGFGKTAQDYTIERAALVTAFLKAHAQSK
jgi:ankyrin repeat protein